MEPLPYIPGTTHVNAGPLARFLPPLEEGTISAWLGRRFALSEVEATHKQGAWLLDPFGFSPRLALEAARTGYRVLVTANNPITRFLLEMAANAPSESELKAALADLSASRKGDERLETHLQNLYLTPCEKCGKEIQAQAFLWRKGEDAPYARLYECPHCEDKGERTATPVDVERAQAIARSASLHRARVLERVASPDDPDRAYAEEALQVYLPRAIYALATLINRLDGLNVSDKRQRLITALILSAFDEANSLHSADRARPKLLTASNQFRENNVWMALEGAVAAWSVTSSQVPFEAWPNRVPAGGVCIFDGRLKSLAEQVRKEIPITAVVGAVPRPNQAFWTLSALWSGWLWGREAAEPFKVGLRRRRYDWGWSATALGSAFRHLSELLPPGTPFFGLLGEPEAPFLTSALTAASYAGFDLSGLAIRTEHDPMQIHWTRGERLTLSTPPPDLEAVRGAIGHYLGLRGEPSAYLNVHAAGLVEFASTHSLKDAKDEFDEALRKTQSTLHAALKGDARFVRYGAGENVETGLWGLRAYNDEALTDRVEMGIVNFLQKNTHCIYLEIEDELYKNFAGLLTPSKALIYQVLNSYAQKENGAYRLRDEDQPAARRAELEQMTASVEAIGKRLGYNIRRDDKAVIWEENNEAVRIFYILASALIGRVVNENKYPAEKCLLVLPGGRALLASYKQQRDPELAAKMKGWRMIKFRLARRLADIPVLTRASFDEQIASDPVEDAADQMVMF